MKVLIVCSYRGYAENTQFMAPFVYEQVQALQAIGVEAEVCYVHGGILGYLRAIRDIRKHIQKYQPNIVHAHGGLCGFVTVLQRSCPVVVTYHGTDINGNLHWFSQFAIKHADWNIFVSQPLMAKAGVKNQDTDSKNDLNCSVIPCGVDTTLFHYINKQEARKQLGWSVHEKYILFSKAFHVHVKNYPLAKAAVDKLDNATLVELYGYSREEVVLLMNASDLGLMTSFTEGSPQFVKEALACGCPIVSTDVGDVSDVIDGVENCYLTTYEPTDVAEKIQKVLTTRKRAIGGVDKIKKDYSSEVIAQKILYIYNSLIK